MTAEAPIIGIDLGTTFSLVGVCDARGPRVLRDERGEGRVPSVLSVTPTSEGRPLVRCGWEARAQAVEHAEATVYSIKRLIGRSPAEIERELPFLAYRVRPGPRASVRIEIDGRLYSPEELSAIILGVLKQRAEAELGVPVRRAVITVPAYFDDAQRQATRDAGAAAGLEVVRIINEPTAAALAYGLGLRTTAAGAPRAGPAELVAVYDLGGGTFDISILRIEGGIYQVLATAGDTHLGGDDFDRVIIQLVQGEVAEQFGLMIDAPHVRQALRSLAEELKIRLSLDASATLELDLGGGRTYRRTLQRAEFEERIAPLVERTTALAERAVRDAGLTLAELQTFILVGGSTRVPLVRRRLTELLGRPPYTALNPDEVVACGAAVQGAILAGQEPDMLLLDVIPLALGIETLGGALGKLILRNTTIPCRATEQFTTYVDGQTAIKINVLQGERELARDCRSLGEFELRGIPPMPAGLPKVEVEFLVDANGILGVTARELRSGQAASIQIVPHYGLTRAEVERLTRESVEFAAADITAHRRIDLRNQVEFDTRKAEQMLERVGGRLPPEERRRIQGELEALRALARTDCDLDLLQQRLTAFGRGTVRLAELGIASALLAGDEPEQVARDVI